VKTIRADKIEDREEYLLKNKIISHEIENVKANFREMAIIIPRYVATPFPPLNFSQIGKICPMKQERADK